MSWWVCRDCEPSQEPCSLASEGEQPSLCPEDMGMVEWRPATPEDFTAIAKSAAEASWKDVTDD